MRLSSILRMDLEDNDVAAVQESWAIAKSIAKLRDHGVGLFELLFTDYPGWRTEFFSHMGNAPMEELRISPKFRAHCTLFVSNLNFWVQNLDDQELVTESVKKLGDTHRARNVMSAQFVIVGEVLMKYLQAALGDQFRKEMELGWTKLMDNVVAIIKENNQEGEEQSLYKRLVFLKS